MYFALLLLIKNTCTILKLFSDYQTCLNVCKKKKKELGCTSQSHQLPSGSSKELSTFHESCAIVSCSHKVLWNPALLLGRRCKVIEDLGTSCMSFSDSHGFPFA